jgi:fructose-1,6-bisphosphatase/inositol monophosphatase family enzyme
MLWDVAAGISLVEGAGGRVEVTSVKPDYVLNVTADNGYIKCL